MTSGYVCGAPVYPEPSAIRASTIMVRRQCGYYKLANVVFFPLSIILT